MFRDLAPPSLSRGKILLANVNVNVNVIVVLNANVLRLDEEVGFHSGLESITADRCRAELGWQ